ncbi:HAD family hydrolase [Corynebacterium aquilae]|uniref:HAD family hydrolase n=1 Tax=Corynebacterium aquilae TaxID=203263 RepID=UPI0009528FD3|nr:HAD family hydrolase [Corynebacterium aquilae]
MTDRFAPRVSAPRGSGARVAAFFDLDKTIIAKSSAFAYSRQFLSNGLITPAAAVQMSFAQAAYMLHGHSSEQMDATRDQLAAMIKGWDVEQVRRIAQETLHTVVTPAIYQEARDLIAHHQALGHVVVIISASAYELVAPIAHELGVSDMVTTRLDIADGRYTGEILQYLKGDAKAEAIRKLVDELHLDLDRCFAYSDSTTDVPMLEIVGNPVAVNPDRSLRKTAIERGWDIMVFKNPVPLFVLPSKKKMQVSTTVVAAAAAVAGAWWLTRDGSAANQLGQAFGQLKRRKP